jgi:hypothetical protein
MYSKIFDTERSSILRAGRPALFGAGLFAKPVIHVLQEHNVPPMFIFDNDPKKHGMIISGIPVLAPGSGTSEIRNMNFVITGNVPYLEEIKKQLFNLGVTKVYSCMSLLGDLEYGDSRIFAPLNLYYEIDRYQVRYLAKYVRDHLVLGSIDVVITEKCSLRCRDCSNLMQYYKNPKDMDLDTVFSALDLIMGSIDHVIELRVLGGETFMNRHAHQFIERLRKYPNYTRIAVYSNGTIVPSGKNLSCLKSKDTYVRITNYGAKSRRLADIKAQLDMENIFYVIDECRTWQDCGFISYRDRGPAELECQYRGCCARDIFTLIDGLLFACPFIANAVNLNAIPIEEASYVRADGQLSRQKVRRKIERLLRDTKYLKSCKFCSGRHIEPTLQPAIQTEAPLPFKVYR